MTDKVIAFTTCASRDDATRIAKRLVEARLAACVNIVPNVLSVYRWPDEMGQEVIEDSAEWMLVVKTAAGLLENLKEELTAIHPYKVPELIAVNIVDGAEGYLNWVTSELRASDDVA